MPTDEEILHVLRTRSPCPTYYIKNVLRDAHPSLETLSLRRRLMAMEKAGAVARHLSWTRCNEISWVAAAPTTKEADHG